VTSLRTLLIAILLGGLAASTLDVGAASLISGKPPGFILQVIASGLLGKASYAGGTGTMVLGMVLQWLMGLIIAAIYVLASVRFQVPIRRWLPCGLAYGVVVYFVMTYAVVPLSAASGHHMPRFHLDSFLANMVAMLVFGVIVAGAARWRLGAMERV